MIYLQLQPQPLHPGLCPSPSCFEARRALDVGFSGLGLSVLTLAFGCPKTAQNTPARSPHRELDAFSLRRTYSLHCSSFLGLPVRILNIKLVKPEKGTTMETVGSSRIAGHHHQKPCWIIEYRSTTTYGSLKPRTPEATLPPVYR